MATEYLYEAISKYIAPILELSGYNLTCEGKFVHKDDPSNILRFTNPRYWFHQSLLHVFQLVISTMLRSKMILHSIFSILL